MNGINRTHRHEIKAPWTCTEAPREVFSRALLKQETTARARNAVRICFHCFCVQQMPENTFWISFHCICSNKMFEGNGKDQCPERMTCVLTRPWPRPGVFFASHTCVFEYRCKYMHLHVYVMCAVSIFGSRPGLAVQFDQRCAYHIRL